MGSKTVTVTLFSYLRASEEQAMSKKFKSLTLAGLVAVMYSLPSFAHDDDWQGGYYDDDWQDYPAPVVREYYSPPQYYQPPPVMVQPPVVVEERYYPPPPQPYYYGYGGNGRGLVGGIIGGALGAAVGNQLGYGDPLTTGLGAAAGALLGHELTE
jgi:hypothetical protein